MTKRRLSILGSTGSVGVSTLAFLETVSRDPKIDLPHIVALVGGRNCALLAEQARLWRPEVTVIADETKFEELQQRLKGEGLKLMAGRAAVIEASGRPTDWVMAAIVGAAGLQPTLAAAGTGAVIAIANKESLVLAGPLLMRTAKMAGGSIIPVDSEHSAIFQVLQTGAKDCVRRLVLMASGGPFRHLSLADMQSVTPAQALAHPVWRMGPKISLDSATLANKGLELIEASYLFEMPASKIDILIHPQHVIHSMVDYSDGATLAQMSVPDMRIPIAYAYGWPDRVTWPAPMLNLCEFASLTFEQPDLKRFPLLRLARESLEMGGHAPCVFNAANEVAGQAFLEGHIDFLDIADSVARMLDSFASGMGLAENDKMGDDDYLKGLISVDKKTRHMTQTLFHGNSMKQLISTQK